jgi:hypothetical protein
MKTSWIIIFAVLLAGCESAHQSASLTAEQAKTAAIRLGNDKAFSLYRCQPFRDGGQSAQFVAGHWLWVDWQGFGPNDFQAMVELAADGSTNKVDVQLLDSKMLLL